MIYIFIESLYMALAFTGVISVIPFLVDRFSPYCEQNLEQNLGEQTLNECCTTTNNHLFTAKDSATRLNYALSIVKQYIKNIDQDICLSCRKKAVDCIEEHLPNIDMVIMTIYDRRKSYHYTKRYTYVKQEISQYIFSNLRIDSRNFDIKTLMFLVSKYENRVINYDKISFMEFLSKILCFSCTCDTVKDMIERKSHRDVLAAMLYIIETPYISYCFSCRGMICDFVANIENIQVLDSIKPASYSLLKEQFKEREKLIIPINDDDDSLFKLVYHEISCIHYSYGRQDSFIKFLYKKAAIDKEKEFNNILKQKQFTIKLEKVLTDYDINDALKILASFMYFDFENYYPNSKNMRERLRDLIVLIPNMDKIDSLNNVDFSILSNLFSELYFDDVENLLDIVEKYINIKFSSKVSFASYVSDILKVSYVDSIDIDTIKNRFDSNNKNKHC